MNRWEVIPSVGCLITAAWYVRSDIPVCFSSVALRAGLENTTEDFRWNAKLDITV